MPTPAAADLRPGRTRLWSSWLWILAAILGAGVLWSAGRLIHDERLRRETLRAVAQDKASEIAGHGSQRFKLLLAEAFGSVWSDAGTNPPADVLTTLARGQAERLGCDCGQALPITRFFQLDERGATPVVSSSAGTGDSLPDATLVRVSAAQRARSGDGSTAHTDVQVVGRHAIVTIVRPAGWRGGTKVYGAVMPVAGLASALFGGIPRGNSGNARGREVFVRPDTMFVHGPDPHEPHIAQHRRLVQLDTLGLSVAAGTERIFGPVANRPYVGSATLAEPLEEFRVLIALTGSQVSMSLLMPIAHDRLWLNGILVLSTIVVCLFAIGSSRREVMLARARSDFVAGVSHDLRMPLAQILLASETLALGRDRNEQDRSVLTGSILREARRLKTMVENVLLFSRSGAVGIDPALHAVDVPALFTEVVESVELAIADAGQSIEVQVADDVRAIADRALLRQALVNVVDNAMKYGPRGQRIMLRADRDAARVRIAVEDQGPGIPPADRDRVFDAYERLARDSTSERTGSGLGLAVAAQIVRACQGTIRIEDGASGARVVVSLPAA